MKSASKNMCQISSAWLAGTRSEPWACGPCGSWSTGEQQTAPESTIPRCSVDPFTSKYLDTGICGKLLCALEFTSFCFSRGWFVKLSLPVFPSLAGISWRKLLTAKRMGVPFVHLFFLPSFPPFFLMPRCDSTDQMFLFPCMQT